jgi:hypothetical protein
MLFVLRHREMLADARSLRTSDSAALSDHSPQGTDGDEFTAVHHFDGSRVEMPIIRVARSDSGTESGVRDIG